VVRSTRGKGRVWIAEDEDHEADFMLTGRFSGYLDRGGRADQRFENLDVEDAIAWGRARAAVVLIRTGTSGYYSAGARNPSPNEYPPWPPAGLNLGRRRVPGFEALDNRESDPPVLWDVRVEAPLDGVDPTPYHDEVKKHPASRDVRAPAPGYSECSAAFLVRAATLQEARATADAIATQAFDALFRRSRESLPEGAFYHGAEVYPHRPGIPVTGPGITY
jgi:hypothetical protein